MHRAAVALSSDCRRGLLGTVCLTEGGLLGPHGGMATPTEENFNDYKKAERKAMELLREMKSASPKKVDIELALLVAVFELHKDSLPAQTIAAIIQGHLKQIVPHYTSQGGSSQKN
jgi:hypothetical protein